MALIAPLTTSDAKSDGIILPPVEQDLLKDTSYSHSTQKLNKIISHLCDCGTEQFVSLPRVAVVGNQSAGKSSLLEAISQIKVPRSAGTCTRCPMEIKLHHAGINPLDWHCHISLRKEYDEMGEKMGGPEIIPFEETNSKESATDLLRGAQMVILNPSVDPKVFVPDGTFLSEKTIYWTTIF